MAVLAAALCAGCGGPGSADLPDVTLRIQTTPLGALDHALYPTLADAVLTAPSDFVIADDRIWVAESRTSVITVLTKDFDFVRRIGRPGKGPGELTSPFTVRVRDGVVSAGDRGTGRFELFDTSGVGIGSLPLRAGHEHVLLGPRRVLAVDMDSATLGTLIEPDGVTPFGLSASGDGGIRTPVPHSQMHRLTLDGTAAVALVPQTTGSLHIHDLEGTHIETRHLPGDVVVELQEHEESMARMFGGALVGSSLVKGIGVSQDGRYVTFATMSETAPILIHDLDGRRILYVNTTGHRLAGRVKNARTATYDDGLLYLLSDASLLAFELALPD